MTENSFSSGYTSFTPLSPETKSITSGFSFTRLFDFSWRKEKTGSVGRVANEAIASNGDNEGPGTQIQQHQIPDITVSPEKKSETSDEIDRVIVGNGNRVGFGKSKSANSSPCLQRKEKGRYRNVKTILRRLSAIAIDRKWHQTSGDFKPDFKQYWMPDEHCKECYECSGKFSTFRRRHHCRVCGQIFCSRCCSQEVPGQNMGFSGNIRVCNYCYKIVKAYVEDDIDKSLEALKEDMTKVSDDLSASEPFGQISNSLTASRTSLSSYDQAVRGVGSTSSLPGIIERELRSQKSGPHYPFDAFGVTPQEAKDIKQEFLRDLWRQISDTGSKLELQNHRFRLKTYPNCFVGHELVDWLLTYGKAANRAQGVAIGQDFLDFGWIESVPATEEEIFKDEYLLYQPGKLAMPEMDSQPALPCQDLDGASHSDGDESIGSASVADDDDDDEKVPFWFRQISSESSVTMSEIMENQAIGTPSLARRMSSSRHLDLDHATSETGERKEQTMGRELSLQMKLDYFEDEDENEKQVRKEIYDQTSKLSLITHVPPPPLDTYVCVEGHPFVSKKKIHKVASLASFADDILRGIEFPRPRSVEQRESYKDDNGESIARERFRISAEQHLYALLKQLIHRDKLTLVWRDVILPIVLQISEQVVPDVRRDDDMDIRRYVWFKKIPIGEKPDLQVISGVVFPKNVVHKKMTCSFTHPKILMLSCAIEYQRVENKLTSIDPVVLQEYEFLKNFIAHVIRLKPNIVLVEKSVARVAQEMLLAAGITLVHNIKSNIMDNISRCTRADVLQSMEQVSRPRLGSCQQFRLQKYQLPDGGSKTLMFFEGCAPDLGCSLVLQGGDSATLAKVKAIMKYLIYVAYHLKLENKFLMDEFALPLENRPTANDCNHEGKARRAVFKITEESSELEEGEAVVDSNSNSSISKTSLESDNLVARIPKIKDDDMLKESQKFNDLLSEILISSSPFCVYPLPYLLTEEGRKCGCRRFIPDEVYVSDLLHNRNIIEDEKSHDFVASTETRDNPNLIFKEPHAFTQSSIIPCPQDQATKCLLADFRARGGLVDLQTYRDFERLHRERRKEVNIKRKGELEQTVKKDVEIYNFEATIANKDKKQNVPNSENDKLDCFNPYNHQRIAVLFSSYSSESHNAPKPCISPWAVFMEFYGRNDITLGGFLERYCFRPSYICYSHNCDIEMIKHVRYFAHGTGSLYIHMRNLDSPIPGYDRTILTWSWCKQCKQVTPVVPLSFESWSLSFAKYLELRFYGGLYTRRASAEPCEHSLHQDHYQYFSFANMVASFKYRPIELYEVIIPSNEVVIGKERQPSEWYDDVEKFCKTAGAVLTQICDRINDLKHIESGLYMMRELHVKNFLSEFQAESYHYHEFLQCLQMKVRSLLNSQKDVSDVFDPSQAPSIHEPQDVSDQLKLKPSEISALMTGIGNMLINLKQKLCEIVLAWNLRLQEYIQQEKRREKTMKLSSSPKSEDLRIVPNYLQNEAGEFYPSVMQDGTQAIDNQAYTCISSQGTIEPVSEVLLRNGAILRQTYFGTEPPKEYVTSEIDTTEVAQPDGDIEKECDQNIVGEAEEQILLTAEAGVQDEVKGYAPLTAEAGVQDEVKGYAPLTAEAGVQDEVKGYAPLTAEAGVQYEVKVHAPLTAEVGVQDEVKVHAEVRYHEVVRNGMVVAVADSTVNEESDVKENDEELEDDLFHKNEKVLENYHEDREKTVGSPYMVIQSSLVESFVNENNKLAGDQTEKQYVAEHVNQTGDASRSSSFSKMQKGSASLQRTGSVNVERGSLYDLSTEQKTISRMASEDSCCSSDNKDHWMAESRDRTATVINTFENEDFSKYLKRKVAGTSQSDNTASHPSSVCAEDGSDADQSDLVSMQDVLDFPDDDQSYLSDVEDNDLKDVDDASEIGLGESAVDYETIDINDVIAEPATEISKLQGVPVVTSDENSSISQKHTENVQMQEHFGHPEESSPNGSSTELRASQNRRHHPLGAQKDISNYFDEQNSSLPFYNMHLNLDKSRRLRGSLVSGKIDKRKPLFEFDDSDSGDSAAIFKGEENQDENNKVMDNDASSERMEVGKQVENNLLKKTTFIDGKVFGHRRLQSAPILYTPNKEATENYVECNLPGSPFEFVKHSTSVHDQIPCRVRSYSHGNTFVDGQEELAKMAEKICQIDRKDLEMDDPEEIQYDEGLEEIVNDKIEVSSTTGSEKKVKEASEFIEDENERKLTRTRQLKGNSEADESESGSSASVKVKKSGHSRNQSLPHSRQAFVECKEDFDSLKLSSSEAIQGSQGQRKGAEKVKKIISHLLPGSSFQPVPIPFPAHEHYLLSPGDSVSVVVNETEPSSIIAYALSSVDYFNQLNSLTKLLSASTIDDDSSKQVPSPNRKNADPLQSISTDVVLRNRKQQSKNLKRPSSWAGVSNKTPFLEYQVDFQATSIRPENANFGSTSSGLESKPSLPRNRIASVEQYLVSLSGLSERFSSNDALDSPADLDDGKTDSIDGMLEDKDDLESLVSDVRHDLPEEKSGKKKDDSKPTIDFNIKLQFQDNSAKFFCNVYYAEQFRCLRQLIFPEGEERYIQSLSRCVFWKARGGKSGSSFSKSLDDRFVMKQMSRLEVQSFVEFAPHYFHYMDKTLKEQRPTALAKILGVYRIGFKNSQTNTTMRQDVLIMENVFYNRKVNKIFDLKGSVRSRYVHNSGKEEVLMDENLLEMICETPLFIRPHSKVILSKAIHNDSEFLASHSVMDYSLLVGIDESKFELVVGIIDYIRTFTWDKKLESYVKSTGILGGQGKMPTVVSPAVYRTRFAEAMHRYFLMVPDKWTGFGADLN